MEYDSEEDDIDYHTLLAETRSSILELFLSDASAISVYVREMKAETGIEQENDESELEGEIEWDEEDEGEAESGGLTMIEYLEAQREAKYRQLAQSISMESNPLHRARVRNAELAAADAAEGDKYTEEQWQLFWQMNPNRHYNKDFDIKNLGSDLALFRLKVAKMREKVRLDIERFNNKSRVSDRTKLFEQMAPKTIDQWT
mmetsp:Transcript_2499/g.7991  ORF Transcript_2499/g.7991 Transcript_2499/m.7991 type:complete len:201 (+) Transcript_2499:55-657(+)